MGLIDAYKEVIGYGARDNLFKISMTIPPLVSSNFSGIDEVLNFMPHKVAFPKNRDVEVQRIQYANEFFTLDKGRKPDDYAEIDFTFRNSQDFKYRSIFEYWLNLIQKPRFGTYDGVRVKPSDYKVNNIKIQILTNDLKTVTKEAILYGAYPIDIDGFDLKYEPADLRESILKFACDYYKFSNPGPVNKQV